MSFALCCMLFEILVLCPETGGKSLTWNEPPPTQVVQTGPVTVNHFSSKQLHEGTINANLSWQFDLTALSFTSLAIYFNGTALASASTSGQGVQSGFENQFGIDWIPNQNLVRLIFFNVTTEEDGTFACQVATSDAGFPFQFVSIVQVDVVAPTSNITSSSDVSVIAPAELTLNCSADGKPKPTITWTRLSDNTSVSMPLNITGENDTGSYRCTAYNGVGDALIKDVFVDVHVPPMVTLASKVFVDREQTASLICEVEGNPTPIISWSPCSGQSVVCDEQYLNISKVQTARANYTCTATNALGLDSATTLLLIGGKNVYLRLNMTGECDNKDSVWKTLQKELGKAFNNTQKYSGADLLNVRCGILVLDVVLKFGFKVAEDDTIFIIQSAIANGNLGELSVNVSYIIGIPPVERSTTAAPSSSTSKSNGTTSAPSTTEPRSAGPEGTTSAPFTTEPTNAEPEDSPPTLWVIIGCATGGVVVLAICVLTWWVHNKRKCRNDAKIHNSDLERDNGEGGYSQVQGAYAQSGPPAANGTDSAAEQQIQAEAVIPTYAAADKSKKSKKQADERPPEYAVVDKSKKTEKQEAAAIPTYAAVDKSKKKNKSHEEVPAVYAEVDKSKKKKKKKIDDKNLYETLDEQKKEKKPGELLYADLGDFQNPSMPTVSTSPQPLPAIKKADPYERTDYADITQFLKGNATFPPNDGNGDTEMKPKRPSKNKIQGNDKETPI